MNDLHRYVNSTCEIFADNTKIYNKLTTKNSWIIVMEILCNMVSIFRQYKQSKFLRRATTPLKDELCWKIEEPEITLTEGKKAERICDWNIPDFS